MKQTVLFFLLNCVLFITHSFAQKENNNWYFGPFAGIDFNSGTPTFITTSAMSAFEGSSSISTRSTGTILFYTDGIMVYNAANSIMTNGTGLTGNFSSAQSALIVADPADTNLYYIFTAGEYFNGGSSGYRYSIVDMTQSSGLGAVTATKNVLLYSPACEKLAAVKNAAGTGYWIATHEFSTGNFVCYELTASGLSAPVISNVGTVYSSTEPIGYMKFSPDGTKLATVLSGLDEVEFYDFDAATGTVSNAITLGPVTNAVPYVYGISFSPNGTRLYVDEENNSNIFQYDLTAGTTADINASKTVVGTTSGNAMQTMQLAPDGRLYITRNGAAYLAVINDPDSIGTDCNFVDNGFYLSGTNSAYGLPNFVESVFAQPSISPGSLSASDTSVCEKFCIDFFDGSLNNATSWLWSFPGGTPVSSTDQNPSNICYQSPGVYDVILIATGVGGSDTITLTDFITVNPTPPFPTITQNGYTLTSSTATTYQWQHNSLDIPGATNQSYDVEQTGYYSVIISDENGCVTASTVYVLIEGIEDPNSGITISIYPNPSNGDFAVELLNAIPGNQCTFEVFNALGQLVYSSPETISSSQWKKSIDLTKTSNTITGVSAGSYYLKIKSDNFFLCRKVVLLK